MTFDPGPAPEWDLDRLHPFNRTMMDLLWRHHGRQRLTPHRMTELVAEAVGLLYNPALNPGQHPDSWRREALPVMAPGLRRVPNDPTAPTPLEAAELEREYLEERAERDAYELAEAVAESYPF